VASDMFFPPTIGLLSGTMTQEWFSNGTAKRLEDEKVAGRPCYQIQVTHEHLKWLVHVDIDDFLIRQIRYPQELLDDQLQNSPDVQHLEIVARFADATWQPEFDAKTFAVKIPGEAKRVKQFVPVPEPFPSANVGKRIADLGLRDASDQSVSQTDWDGKVTLLCWTNNASDGPQLLKKLQAITESLSPKQYAVARVEVFQGALPGNPQVATRLAELASESSVPVLADYGFNAGRTLGLAKYPMFAVIDRQGICNMSDHW